MEVAATVSKTLDLLIRQIIIAAHSCTAVLFVRIVHLQILKISILNLYMFFQISQLLFELA